MNRIRAAGLVLLLAAATATATACGEKAHRSAHGGAKTTPEPAPPTPDTTPIEALRTPAGLVLKIDAAQTPSAPLRGATEGRGEVTPVPSPSKP